MIIQNALTTNIVIPELLSTAQGPAPLVLIPSTPTTIFNSDAEKSVTLKNAIAAASVTVIDSTTEPSIGIAEVKITGTCSATPGTRTNHAHGLSYTPSKVILVPTAADDNVDNAGAVAFVKADATNIVVKSDVASVTFTAYVV